jgi:ATP-dependent Clp protease ATP-binding subunit ClpX
MPLTADTLVNILTEPKNALIRQYEYFFSMENAQLEFTKDALYALAQKALKRETGARALRSVMEELMLELMYELPDMKNEGVTYLIDEDAVENGANLAELRVQKKESA